MKNEKRERRTEMKSLKMEEMMMIRGGTDRPDKPKSPGEVVIMI